MVYQYLVFLYHNLRKTINAAWIVSRTMDVLAVIDLQLLIHAACHYLPIQVLNRCC